MRSEFEVQLPVGERGVVTAIALMWGDQEEFLRRLEDMRRAGRWEAAVLATPVPVGDDGPITGDHVDALNAVGDAVVRLISSA